MLIPTYLMAIIVSIITSLLVFAVSYGKLGQRVKELEENQRRIEDTVNATKYEIKDQTKLIESLNKTLFEMKGSMDMFIKVYCLKDKINE